MQNFNISIFNKIFGLIFFSALGISTAIIINTYISYKLFSLPTINSNVEKKKINTTNYANDYKYLKHIFIKNNLTTTTSKNTQSNTHKKDLITIQNINNIKLEGIIRIKNKNFAILNKNNQLILVKEGKFFEGYKVKKIENYYLILEKNGKLYKVSLEVDKSVRMNSSFSKINKNTKSNKNFINNEGNIIQIDKRFIEEKTADIGTILKDVLLVPEIKNGQTIGFRFKYIKPNSLLYKLGLRSGDLIISVNNMPVKTAEEAFKIYNIIRNEKYVNVEIERKGQRKVLTYEVR
ncbi:MAG TPA: hypothetical protein EYH43_04195 [Persephonella sp.]|nr:hypothetical protein [Hydrogenothermaceae bacterium]HIQ25165.1 hypothetical protein [Persephonella sp.]